MTSPSVPTYKTGGAPPTINGDRPKQLPYKSIISPRSSSISCSKMIKSPNRPTSATPPLGSAGFGVGICQGQCGFGLGLPYNMYTPSKMLSGTSLREFREKEKRELVELNDRFANYVERVRLLEAQNKHLKAETDALRGQLGNDNGRIKSLYETELQQARDVITSTGKEHMILEAKVLKAEDDAKFYRSRYEDLLSNYQNDQEKLRDMSTEMFENQASINLLKRRMKDMEEELDHNKTESQKLLLEVQRLSSELFNENSSRLQLQNEKLSLEEELNFLKQVHAQELEDMEHRHGFKEPYLDPSAFFRHELSNAIRDIREEYDALHQQQRGEMEGWYRLKLNNAIQELQNKHIQDYGIRSQKPKENEIKNLHDQVTNFRRENTVFKQKIQEQQCAIDELTSLMRSEKDERAEAVQNRDEVISDLKSKLEDLLAEYEDLASNNNNLNAEISIYRKLLEGSDGSDGLRQIAEGIEQQAKSDWSKSSIASLNEQVPAESPGKPTTQRVVTFRSELTISASGGHGNDSGNSTGSSNGGLARALEHQSVDDACLQCLDDPATCEAIEGIAPCGSGENDGYEATQESTLPEVDHLGATTEPTDGSQGEFTDEPEHEAGLEHVDFHDQCEIELPSIEDVENKKAPSVLIEDRDSTAEDDVFFRALSIRPVIEVATIRGGDSSQTSCRSTISTDDSGELYEGPCREADGVSNLSAAAASNSVAEQPSPGCISAGVGGFLEPGRAEDEMQPSLSDQTQPKTDDYLTALEEGVCPSDCETGETEAPSMSSSHKEEFPAALSAEDFANLQECEEMAFIGLPPLDNATESGEVTEMEDCGNESEPTFVQRSEDRKPVLSEDDSVGQVTAGSQQLPRGKGRRKTTRRNRLFSMGKTFGRRINIGVMTCVRSGAYDRSFEREILDGHRVVETSKISGTILKEVESLEPRHSGNNFDDVLNVSNHICDCVDAIVDHNAGTI